MIVQEVFTPNNYPEHTYVEREHGEYEEELSFRLKGPATIISLSGPSKSGKTMLLNNAVEDLNYDLVTVHGSNIDSVTDLWENTLDQLGAPTNREIIEESQNETIKEGNAGIDISVVNAGGGGSKRDQQSTQETASRERMGLKQITELVNLDDFVLYIDDAHYIDKKLHEPISEAIKDAYERGMSICVSFIPYRSDDLTRANPDLSGRIESIDLGYWDKNDLEKIGEMGFEILNRYPSELVIKNLARESVGSPHLMQKLCLEMCRELKIHERTDEMEPLRVEENDLKNVLRNTAEDLFQDYSTIIEILCGDVSQDNNGRKIYDFPLKGQGDVYDVILRALAANPPRLTLDRGKILDRVQDTCHAEAPQSGNIVQTIQRIDKWISNKVPESDYCFDWVDDRKALELPDPYLIFCIRWSNTLNFEPKLH